MEDENTKKKPYEPPSFRQVRLDVKTSVLATCSLSVGVSPEIGACQTSNPCVDVGS